MIVRSDADGNPTSFQARYINPLAPPKKVGRNFGLKYKTGVFRWLYDYIVWYRNKRIKTESGMSITYRRQGLGLMAGSMVMKSMASPTKRHQPLDVQVSRSNAIPLPHR